MFGLFGSKKGKNGINQRKKTAQKGDDQPKSREDLKKEAMANARAARENIGEETLDKIADAMTRKQKSNVEKARREITRRSEDQIAENLRDLMNDDHVKK